MLDETRIVKAIKALPLREHKVFVLRNVQQKSYDQIAAELGISVAAVERAHTKALAACRRALPDEDSAAPIGDGSP